VEGLGVSQKTKKISIFIIFLKLFFLTPIFHFFITIVDIFKEVFITGVAIFFGPLAVL
jgi:hypothetical protein